MLESRGTIFFLVVSLGTEVGARPIDYDKAKDWGKAEWARPVIDAMMDGVANAVNYQLRQMLTENKYYRFNTCLWRALNDMDAANRANINALKREREFPDCWVHFLYGKNDCLELSSYELTASDSCLSRPNQ